jgi:hypothetical protein
MTPIPFLDGRRSNGLPINARCFVVRALGTPIAESAGSPTRAVFTKTHQLTLNPSWVPGARLFRQR